MSKALCGVPELIIEVSKATRYVDLGPKLADYEQAGVLEYLVRALDPDEVFLFRQEQGTLIEPAGHGRSLPSDLISGTLA